MIAASIWLVIYRKMMKSLDKSKDMFYKLVDNTHLKFGEELLHPSVGIPTGTNCADYNRLSALLHI